MTTTAADAVIFDLDGVLVDSRRAFVASVNAALREHGSDARPAEELHRYLDCALDATFAELLEDMGARVDACIETFRVRHAEKAAAETKVYKGIVDVLWALRDTRPLVVATAQPQWVAEPLIERIGLRHHFDGVFGPVHLDRGETKSETIGRALEFAEAIHDVEDPAMVGDRGEDMEAAREHGMTAVGVLWGLGSHTELRRADADVLVEKPAELSYLLA